MAEEFQAEPPRPRRDWGDDVGDRPVKRSSEGMPAWAWVLIGVGALSLCLVPAVLVGGLLFLQPSAPPPVPPVVAPAPAPVAPPEDAPRPQPEKEKVP